MVLPLDVPDPEMAKPHGLNPFDRAGTTFKRVFYWEIFMSEYTKEPWSLDKYENILAGEDVLLLGGIRTPMTAGPSMDEARANARRIVACVNACDGIDDPAEFIAGIRSELSLATHKLLTCGVAARHPDVSLSMREADYGGKWNSPQAESVRQIRQQRDELLAALEAAIECGMVPTSSAKEGGAMRYVKQAHVADQIRAAIAKAKGGAV